jgi:deoxycytidine triphosphate deaminase
VYLADHEIEALLPDLDITTKHEAHPFDANTQVQPCSIDLRVSDVFWKPSRRRARWRRLFARGSAVVDLRESHMEELDPRRDWRSVILKEGQALKVRPGEILMGRVYERFAIPRTCAGKIEGRSSYARLGLQVHCTGDFINPGWGGYMPLQLFNAGPYPIQITPFAPICQLMLIPLHSDPRRAYGQEDLNSKYVNDDGGPSFWWRDKQMARLHERLTELSMPAGLEGKVLSIVRFEDPELLARFQRFVRRSRVGELQDADSLLGRFSTTEIRRKWWDRGCVGAFPLLLAASLGSLLETPIGTLHYVLWVATVLAGPVSLRGIALSDTDYLDRRALNAARSRQRPDNGR